MQICGTASSNQLQGFNLARSNNATVSNNIIRDFSFPYGSGVGLSITGLTNSTITNNTLTNIAWGGIAMGGSNNIYNRLTIINCSFSSALIGALTSNSGLNTNNSFNNIYIDGSNGIGKGISLSYFAGYMNETTFTNLTIVNVTSNSVYLKSTSDVQNSLTFINATYNTSSEYVGTSSQLIRKWYLDVNVSNSTAQLENANVTGFNTTGNSVFSELTAATGFITQQQLIEYINDGTRTYYTPYNISTSLTGYDINTTAINLTLTQNTWVNVRLSLTPVADTIYPTFSNYWDNNATLVTNGTGMFNVTILNTNGTVYLNINGTSIQATNLTANVYNASISLTTGTYLYNWSSYGNGTSHNLNYSANMYYTVNNTADTTPPNINFSSNTPATGTSQTNTDIFVGVNSSDASNISVFSDFDNSLVSWWRFENNAVDYTGRNNGTIVGGVTNTSGKMGNAYGFDGTNNYIDIGKNVITTTSFTVSGWAKNLGIPGGAVKQGNLFEQRDDSIGNNKVAIAIYAYYNSTNSAFQIRSSSGSNQQLYTPLHSNTWDYYSLTVNSTYISFYINGVLAVGVANTQAGDYVTSTDYIDIGRSRFSAANQGWFNGSIDDVMIFNRSLSASEVAGFYANSSSKYVTNNFTNLGIGTHTFKGYAQDTAGNVNFTDLRSVTITESTPPQISFVNPTLPNNTQTTNTSIPINISIVEPNLASFVYNWNNTNYSIYDSNLVLMMNFENKSSLGENSTHIKDLSRYGNNGGVTGAVWNSSGKYGGGYQFDGSSGYVSITDKPELSGGHDLTVGVWFKASNLDADTTSYPIPLVMKYESSSNKDWGLGLMNKTSANKKIWFGYESGGNNWDTTGLAGTTNLSVNIWYYATFVYNNTSRNLEIYLNGVKETNATLPTSTPDTATNVEVGRSGYQLKYFNGSIDEVRIFNRSLSASEISQLYMSNLQKFNTTDWNFYINQSKNSSTGLDVGNYTYQGFATDTGGFANQTDLRFVSINSGADTTYPTFSNYWDNNATLIGSGIGLFNVTVTNTNGTVLLEINNTNITATNLTANVYNATYNFTSSGAYSYKWISWGNGTSHLLNYSANRYYTINQSTNLTDCGTLNQANTVYTLQNDVSSLGTCFTITANNITLDGNGKNITYNLGWTGGVYGVYSTASFTIVRNALVSTLYTGPALYGIYYSGVQNGTIYNNTITLPIGPGGINSGILIDSNSNYINITNNIINNIQTGASGISISDSNYGTITSNIITTGSSAYGIFLSSSSNSNLANNTITTSGGSAYGGVYIASASNYNNVTNNTITSSGSTSHGIMINTADSNILTNNTITTSGEGLGIYLLTSGLNNVSGNIITTSGESLASGIRLTTSPYNSITGNTISTTGTASRGFYLEYGADSNILSGNIIITQNSPGVYIANNANVNNLFKDTTISSSSAESVYIDGTSQAHLNNTFLNVSYIGTNQTEVVLGPTSSELIRKWYLDVNVSNSTAQLENANVTGWNITSNSVFSELTATTGFITQQQVIEYINTGTRTYANNHTINTSLATYDTDSQELNLTGNTQLNISLTLTDILAPNVTINSPLNQSYSTISVTFNLTAVDASGVDSCVYSLDGADNVSLVNNAGNYWDASNESMTAGSHTVQFYCVDTLGYLNLTSVLFNIDLVNPSAEFVSPTTENGMYWRDWISVNVTASDYTGVGIINVTLWNGEGLNLTNSSAYGETTFFWNITGLLDDTYYLNATVNDTGGNVGNTTSYTIVLNTTSYVVLNTGWNLISLELKNRTTGEKNITLNEGWNLIGYSGAETTTIDDLNVSFSPTKSWEEGVSDGNVSAYLAFYDSSAATSSDRKYKYAATSELNMDSSELEADKGYWVYANTSGTLSITTEGSNTGESYAYSDLRVSNGTDEKTIAEADAAGWIESVLKYYGCEPIPFVIDCSNPDSWEFMDLSSGNLNSYQGYFINGLQDNITLIRRN